MSYLNPLSNVQIDVDKLPSVDDVRLIPLEKNYLRVRLIVWLVWTVIFVGMYLVAYIIFDVYTVQWLFLSASFLILFLILLIFVFSYFGYNYMFYAVRQKDIMFTRGLVIRTTTVVPFNRIQHIEVGHGPVDRFFGLATLKVFTAGGQSSDLQIPGLSRVKAQQLKDFITRKAALDEEE